MPSPEVLSASILDLAMEVKEVLYVLLLEAGLELVPESICNEPAVRKDAKLRQKRPTEILLDNGFHGSAVAKLPHHEKRGRPDIIHTTLLHVMNTPLFKENALQVYVHTIHGKIFKVPRDWRIPVHYLRFSRLMEQFLNFGQVPPKAKDPILKWEENLSLHGLLSRFKKARFFLFDSAGEYLPPSEFVDLIRQATEDVVIAVGAFQRGSFFSPELEKFPFQKITFDPDVTWPTWSIMTWWLVPLAFCGDR